MTIRWEGRGGVWVQRGGGAERDRETETDRLEDRQAETETDREPKKHRQIDI